MAARKRRHKPGTVLHQLQASLTPHAQEDLAGRRQHPITNTHLPRQTRLAQRRGGPALAPGPKEHTASSRTVTCPANLRTRFLPLQAWDSNLTPRKQESRLKWV